MKGYKALNKDYTCRGFKYDIGQTYKHEGKLEMCRSGFHFCANAVDCFGYYPADSIIVEVEATGDVQQEGTKCVTNEIRIIRELTQDEIKCGNYNSGGYNSGNYNSGYYNSGSYNSGDCNSGYYNSGYCNSGNYNSGYYNSGSYNSGNCNSGNCNSGDCNSGYYNSGSHNSGSHNSGDYNSGFFNSNTPTVRLFNCDSGLSYEEFCCFMPEEFFYHISAQKLTHKDIKFLKSLPNYDADIFEECTGIRIADEVEE